MTEKGEREPKKNQTRHVERSLGTFSRSLTRPSDADGDRPRAPFQDGVLTIRVPGREEAKPRVIDIQAS